MDALLGLDLEVMCDNGTGKDIGAIKWGIEKSTPNIGMDFS